MTSQDLCALIARHKFKFQGETMLQDGIEVVLQGAGVPYVREHALSRADRPDFLVDGHIALEVKIKASTNDLLRQVHRYAKHADVAEIVVVTNSMRLSALPDEMLGKPISVVTLIGAFA